MHDWTMSYWMDKLNERINFEESRKPAAETKVSINNDILIEATKVKYMVTRYMKYC